MGTTGTALALVVAAAVPVVLTHINSSPKIFYMVTGQAPTPLEWKKIPQDKINKPKCTLSNRSMTSAAVPTLPNCNEARDRVSLLPQKNIFIAGCAYITCPLPQRPLSIVPVARYSACEIGWHRWEQPVVAVCGVVPVAALVWVFPADTHRLYRLVYRLTIFH